MGKTTTEKNEFIKKDGEKDERCGESERQQISTFTKEVSFPSTGTHSIRGGEIWFKLHSGETTKHFPLLFKGI
jgi:hypothetical protein